MNPHALRSWVTARRRDVDAIEANGGAPPQLAPRYRAWLADFEDVERATQDAELGIFPLLLPILLGGGAIYGVIYGARVLEDVKATMSDELRSTMQVVGQGLRGAIYVGIGLGAFYLARMLRPRLA